MLRPESLAPGAVYETVRANGIDFEVLCAGSGDRLALCLHGFPEHAISWRHQFPVLVRLGYRVWAPNQRGYGRTTRPRRVEEYAITDLMADVAALIDAAGARSVTLIGHDWGAAVAWFFAMRAVRPVERLVIVNVPHPALFLASLRNSWRQRARSWYAAFFQIPWLPERLLGLNDALAIAQMFSRSSCDPSRFPEAVIRLYREQAAEPGALAAMLAWYRAAARGGLKAEVRQGFPVIEVPTLMLWGERDTALGKETTYGTERYVRHLELHYLPGVSHCAQQEAPQQTNAYLEAFLAGNGASGAWP